MSMNVYTYTCTCLQLCLKLYKDTVGVGWGLANKAFLCLLDTP